MERKVVKKRSWFKKLCLIVFSLFFLSFLGGLLTVLIFAPGFLSWWFHYETAPPPASLDIVFGEHAVNSVEVRHFINRPYSIDLTVDLLDYVPGSDSLKNFYRKDGWYRLVEEYSYRFVVNAYRVKGDVETLVFTEEFNPKRRFRSYIGRGSRTTVLHRFKLKRGRYRFEVIDKTDAEFCCYDKLKTSVEFSVDVRKF